MRIPSSMLPRLAALLLAGVSATYAVSLMFSQPWDRTGLGWALLQVWVGSIPLVFLLVALTVLFQRLRDRDAWVMALMFCGFMSLMNPGAAGASPALPGFMMACPPRRPPARPHPRRRRASASGLARERLYAC